MVASALAAAGALGGGLLASRGASKAADTTAAAANRAADLNMQQYLLGREDMSPWRYGGQNALQLMLMGTTGMGLPGTTRGAAAPVPPGGGTATGPFPMPNGIGGGIGALPDRWWENPYYSGESPTSGFSTAANQPGQLRASSYGAGTMARPGGAGGNALYGMFPNFNFG